MNWDQSLGNLGDSVCPECCYSKVETCWGDSSFTYGSGAGAVEISVRLPVRKCCKCRFEFFDEEAEDLSHEAVCRHLGRLTPREIRAIRERLSLSLAGFSELVGVSVDVISQWERGTLLQNREMNDVLLDMEGR